VFELGLGGESAATFRGLICQISRLSASAIMPLTTYQNPSTEEAQMVTTTTANLRVLEPCLPKGERETLRHFLGLLLEADEPEAMVASLRRLAERKAWYAVSGARVDRQAAQRWQALAEALAKVERQVTPQRSSPATETFAD
jgi:hypothetical protein